MSNKKRKIESISNKEEQNIHDSRSKLRKIEINSFESEVELKGLEVEKVDQTIPVCENIQEYSQATKLRLIELEKWYKHNVEEWCRPELNPHIYKQLVGNDTQKFRSYYSALNLPLVRKMKPHHPLAVYRRRFDEEKSVIHWGQRKLLMTEIEFLTKYGHLSEEVVYAGAAPGTHIKYLSSLFPSHQFYLYDPAPFSNTLKDIKNIELHQLLFTDKIAEKWERSGVLFISDIRSADPDIMEEDEVEENVKKDMSSQLHWCKIIQPAMCSLKFRLPWKNGTTEYLDGDIYYQVWGPPTTTETRLFSNCLKMKKYIHSEYEQRLFYFNTISRLGLYYHEHLPAEGIDYCYDCTTEIKILTTFFTKFPKMLDILLCSNLISVSSPKQQDFASTVSFQYNRNNKLFFTHSLTLDILRKISGNH